MKIVVGDWESFFDNEFTLSKLSTEQYIRDPRFEAHGCAFKWAPDQPARWYSRHQVTEVIRQWDWSDTFIIHHHGQFDSLIESHHYDMHPKAIGCTLAMSRLLLGNHIPVSLDSIRKHFGLPLKRTPYDLFKGKHWDELSPAVQAMVADGACDEVESIWTCFNLLMKDFPREELGVVDLTIKMFSEPMLRGDLDLLASIWEEEDRAKGPRMAALGVTSQDLQSADKFAELLRQEGIEPEKKKGKNGDIYAFAKTDPFMRDYLLEHESERVRTLAETRLAVKSTVLQTRAETFGWMARRGPMPVYLRYAGAGTLRFSGGDGTNFTNLKRQHPIRKSLKSPEGYWLAPVDSSQIECRVAHYLAGGPDEPVIQIFKRGEDPYVGISSQFYGETIYKPKQGDPRFQEMEAKRGMGKQGRLMCQYGASGKQFKITARNGLYGPPVDMSIEDANRFVTLYRTDNPSICAPGTGYWAQAGRMLARLGGGEPLQWGPLLVKDHRIFLPNGCPLIYDTLEFHRPEPGEELRNEFDREGYWRVRTRNGWKTMWGSKLVQNICEAVSRVIITQAALRIRAMGLRILNIPHDELLIAIPRGHQDAAQDERAQLLLEGCKLEMKRDVPWLPGLPLDCEGELSERYSK